MRQLRRLPLLWGQHFKLEATEAKSFATIAILAVAGLLNSATAGENMKTTKKNMEKKFHYLEYRF